MTYLLDKSAYEQQRRSSQARQRLLDLVDDLALCDMVALEVLYSAQNQREYRAIKQVLWAYRWFPVTSEVMTRALEVQALLADKGQHRLALPDLIIAATAEAATATVLHYDKDFDLIAAVTEQPVEWIVPRGEAG